MSNLMVHAGATKLTRAMKKLPAARAFGANVELGRAFGMTSAN